MAKNLIEQMVEKSIVSLTEKELQGLKNIKKYSLAYFGSLTNLVIPNSVTTVEDYGVSNCTSLTTVSLPNTITSFGLYVFSSCSALTNVNIPTNLTELPASTFSDCSKLATITIPRNIGRIRDSAFKNTSAISNIYFNHSSSDSIILPTAGSSAGMFYRKTARSANVYTDNETVKNYAWSSDNITATFYHLDGTAW